MRSTPSAGAWRRWATDARFVDALPTALVKPFSGSAARAMLIETMQTQGVDSFAALAAATIQGSTETTFYVLAVYFGAVGIQRARHAVACALLAELAGGGGGHRGVLPVLWLNRYKNWPLAPYLQAQVAIFVIAN